MKSETYQIMLDDLGDLVDILRLPLGEMMQQSPRNVLLACIERVKEYDQTLRDISLLTTDGQTAGVSMSALEMCERAGTALRLGRPPFTHGGLAP